MTESNYWTPAAVAEPLTEEAEAERVGVKIEERMYKDAIKTYPEDDVIHFLKTVPIQ